MTRRGGCLCGAVTFVVTGELRPVIACHCSRCRKAAGNFVAATSAPRAAVQITGMPRWFQSSDAARRGFCPTCGSNLFWDGPGANLSIMAGAFDGPTDLQLTGHIYCDEIPDWYVIGGDLPKAARADPRLTTMVLT